MLVIRETALKDFEYWCGARAITDHLTDEEFNKIEETLNELYPNGLTATEINDIFWFDDDFICEIIGYQSFEDFYYQRIAKERK